MDKQIEDLIALRSQLKSAVAGLFGGIPLTPSDHMRFMDLSDDELRSDLTEKANKAAVLASALEKLAKAGLTDEEKAALK